ncbi:hypothetical protein D3C76_1076090 [compost metagenome]
MLTLRTADCWPVLRRKARIAASTRMASRPSRKRISKPEMKLRDQLKPSLPNNPADAFNLALAASRRCSTCSTGRPSCND